ncbi:hypothetical protein ACH5RR_018489 [Cinchona calisaya]|uniref:Uncharacterized protein n=1 Tax=Cinchona calisaya TaxID=153742 RepID=A0ABD2ZLM4_9GENT
MAHLETAAYLPRHSTTTVSFAAVADDAPQDVAGSFAAFTGFVQKTTKNGSPRLMMIMPLGITICWRMMRRQPQQRRRVKEKETYLNFLVHANDLRFLYMSPPLIEIWIGLIGGITVAVELTGFENLRLSFPFQPVAHFPSADYDN